MREPFSPSYSDLAHNSRKSFEDRAMLLHAEVRTARARGRSIALAILVGVVAFVFYAADVAQVPFHPDETSWIAMSHDFDIALHDFGQLRWRRGEPRSSRVQLRLLNAPLPKYAIGLGRWISGYREAAIADWDWTISWDENVAAGALPQPALLDAARLTAVVVCAASVGMFFVVGVEMIGVLAAVVATVLLVLHPLEQLHLRRAMAESTLQLFSLLAVFAIVRFVRRSLDPDGVRPKWWDALFVGLTLGLAVASKQSAVALVIVAGWATITVGVATAPSFRSRTLAAIVLLVLTAVSAAVTFIAVNPVLYDQPLRAGYRMVTTRRALAESQTAYSATVYPEMALATPWRRLRASYREAFWNPPSFSEFADNDAQIAQAVGLYRARWASRVANARPVRFAFLVLGLLGLAGILHAAVRERFSRTTISLQVLLVWTFANLAFFALFVPLDWQRYFVPLLPPVCLLAGKGATMIASRLKNLREIQ